MNNLRPFLLAAPDERQLVARKFQTGYTYEMDKDIDETSEYRKTAFHQKDGMDGNGGTGLFHKNQGTLIMAL